MKVQSTFYPDFISWTVDILLISSFINMPILLIFDAFTLLIREKNVANNAFLRCKIFSLKTWLCKILDKYHVWYPVGASVYIYREGQSVIPVCQIWHAFSQPPPAPLDPHQPSPNHWTAVGWAADDLCNVQGVVFVFTAFVTTLD